MEEMTTSLRLESTVLLHLRQLFYLSPSTPRVATGMRDFHQPGLRVSLTE
jgi:hypothetical protein